MKCRSEIALNMRKLMNFLGRGIVAAIFFSCLAIVQVQAENITEDGFKYAIQDGSAIIYGYSHPQDTSWDIVIPEKVTHEGKQYTVTEIEQATFKTLMLTSVTIPSGVKVIDNQAFMNCSGMTSVTFAEGSQLETIGDEAFCITALAQVTIPKSVTSIGEKAFEETDLTSVTFEQGSKLKTIGADAFSGLTTVTSISLPNGLETIGNYAFWKVGISSVVIPATVTSIGDYAFASCKDLTSVTFETGSRLMSIGASAFYQIPISSIEIPKTVTFLGANAFSWCRYLKTITFAEGSQLETIGASAFYFATKLTGIEIPATVTTIGASAFSDCYDLQNVVIPQNSQLETIGASAFYAADGFSTVYLPETLTSIGEYAFSATYITEIVIPSSVTTIGTGAFGKNTHLEVIYYPDDLKDQMEDAMLDMNEDTSSFAGVYGEYTISDTTPPTVSVTYTGNVTGELEPPSNSAGGEVTEVKIGAIPPLQTKIGTSCVVKKLSELSAQLPEGYVFQTPATALSAATETTHNVIYKVDANTSYTFKIAIIVAAHQENKTILYTESGEKPSTCTNAGRGHTECDVCQDFIQENVEVKALGHKWNGGVVTKVATRMEKGLKTFTCTVCQATKTEEISALGAHAKGTKLPDDKNQAYYKVTKAGLTGGTVEYVKPVNKNKTKVSIPSTVILEGITYKVTSIAKYAFRNNKKLNSVTIGENVSKIGSKAFYNCKKLKKITIKTTKLSKKKVGSKAFGKTHSKATVKVPKKKLKAYKNMLKARGISKKAKIKK